MYCPQVPTSTTPHQSHYKPVKPLIMINACMVGELSWWEVVRILPIHNLCENLLYQTIGKIKGHDTTACIIIFPYCVYLFSSFFTYHIKTIKVPDICDQGYYGPQCTEKCHCLNGTACDKDTGECPQPECAAGYDVLDRLDGKRNCSGTGTSNML